jgi:carboxymethylenebutenolidase
MIRVPEAWKGFGTAEPLDKLANPLSTPTLAIIGEQDPYTPSEDVTALERTRVTVVRYPEAEHGFVHDPDRPSHRAADAADAWQRAIAFLSS